MATSTTIVQLSGTANTRDTPIKPDTGAHHRPFGRTARGGFKRNGEFVQVVHKFDGQFIICKDADGTILRVYWRGISTGDEIEGEQ